MRYLLHDLVKMIALLFSLSSCLVCVYYYADTSLCWFYYTTDMPSVYWWHYYLATFSSFLLLLGGSSVTIAYFCILYAVYQKITRRCWIVDYYQPLGWVALCSAAATLQRMYSISLFETRCYGGIVGQIGYHYLSALKDPIIIQSVIGALVCISCILSTNNLLITCAQQLHVVYTALRKLITPMYHYYSVCYKFNVFSRPTTQKLYSCTTFDKQISDYIVQDDQPYIKESAQHLMNPLKEYIIPLKDIFGSHKASISNIEDQKDLNNRAQRLEQKLQRFGIEGKVSAIIPGPVITFFEYTPSIDAKISRIVALEDDLALALEALSVRIVAPVPGRSVVGFEVANKIRNTVLFSEVICSESFTTTCCDIALALGQDVKGDPIIVDLAIMPHLLVAGTTGSGKSGVLNVILMSILCKQSHQHTRLILIDPKRLEFSVYADIPHLLFPIITEVKKIAPILKWVLKEMYERYATMEKVGVRNVIEYNQYAQLHDIKDFYSIVIIVDELADIMLSVGKEVEELIVRIAQMARAASIHLVIATQRPSVDVITGLIKGNFPSRIACRVASKVDSRTILDCNGAQKLLGKGDMLLLSSSEGLKRVHGAYVCADQITKLINYLKYYGPPDYISLDISVASQESSHKDMHHDELYDQIIVFVASSSYISISLLQRRFRIGYNRSARIVEQLEAEGIIAYDATGKLKRVANPQ